MRIIGYLEHPVCKITIFKMEHRLTIKFEYGVYEQAYKFRIADNLSTVEDVKRLVDDTFMAAVMSRFGEMSKDSAAAQERFFKENEEPQWEEKIV